MVTAISRQVPALPDESLGDPIASILAAHCQTAHLEDLSHVVVFPNVAFARHEAEELDDASDGTRFARFRELTQRFRLPWVRHCVQGRSDDTVVLVLGDYRETCSDLFQH